MTTQNLSQNTSGASSAGFLRPSASLQRLIALGLFSFTLTSLTGCVWVHKEDKDKAPDKVVIHEKEAPPTDHVIITH